MTQFMQPYQQKNFAALSDNINQILMGQQPTAKGISGIDETQTQSMVNASMRDLGPQYQSNGLLNSGTAIQASARTAADIRNSNAQFNASAAQNLFNLAIGGQSNLQAQGTSLTSVLGAQLAGLRGTSSSTKSSSSTMGASYTACWVAAEIFGGWYEYKTCMARLFILNVSPTWFREFYCKHGEKFAEFISNKPIIKALLRPLFELFAFIGESNLKLRRA